MGEPYTGWEEPMGEPYTGWEEPDVGSPVAPPLPRSDSAVWAMTEIYPGLLDECPDFTTCVIQIKEDLDDLLERIEESKIQDWLLAASETSYSYQLKLLLMTDDQQLTYDRVQQEYNLDPRYSLIVNKDGLHNVSGFPEVDSSTVVKIFGNMSEDGNTVSGYSGSTLAHLLLKLKLERATVIAIDGTTTTDFQHDFIRAFRFQGIKAVLETSQGDKHMYQMMGEMDGVSEYHTLKRPVDHTTQYDHQQILLMEDNPIVRKAASFLYEKHPAVSSVYVLDEHHKPKLIHGDSEPLTADSRLVLVGHGGTNNEGGTSISGYNAKEVAKIIGETHRNGDQIKTLSLVACDVGSDKHFIETLMKELHEANIETELHLRNTEVQVSHTGEKYSVEFNTNGLEWRHKDGRKNVVATLDKNRNVIIREQTGNTGEAVFTSERNPLGLKESWPEAPQDFIHSDVQTENSVRHSCVELQALAWGMFHNIQDHPQKTKAVNGDYHIYEIRNNEAHWLDKEEIENMSYYDIKSGKDMLNIIHHYAKTGENELSYLMINDFIYKVDQKNLYVYPVGKKLDNNEVGKTDEKEIEDCITAQIGKESYYKMRQNMYENLPHEQQENVKVKYVEYLKGILTGEHTIHPSLSERAWFNSYLTASIISESARNFRTFPLVLMALDMFQNPDNNVKQMGLDFFFEDHPMARQYSWIDPSNRGFKGSSTWENSRKLLEKTRTKSKLSQDLKNLIGKESEHFQKWSDTVDNNIQASHIFDVAEKYSVVDPSQRDAFLKSYSEFKTTIQQQHQSPVYPERPSTSGGLGGSDDGSVTLQDLHHASESEISLKLASYYSRAAVSFAKQIHDQLNTKYGKDLAGLHVKQDSAKMEDGTFKCQLLSADVNTEPIDFNVDLPADGLEYNEKMLKSMNEAVHDMETHGSDSSHHGSKHIERASTAVGTLGLMLGMKGAVQAFERGDIKDGVLGTAQTLHGVTGMTLAVIGKQAESLEGRVAKSVVKLMRSSPMKNAMQVLPIVGIGFGIYNVEEDLKQNDTLGYLDAALDLEMVGLDIIEAVQPELAPFIAPFNVALAVIRIAIDDVYMGIQNELNSLPNDAGLLEKLAAVYVGSIKGNFHLAIHVASFFYDWHYDEIEQGHKLVEQISDYREYYKVTAEEDGTKAIDFSSGGSSWNGGGIHFDLKNNGLSEICMDFFVSSDESVDKKCWDVNTSGSRDIILGIGESHQLNHTTYEKKVLLFIPAGSGTVVSGYIPLLESRYGHYTGNSEDNRFFAVQKAQDKHTIEVMLSYYYRLHGEPGDDTFFLGSQKSYVKGSGGKDTYIIPDGGGKTTINNYDPSMSMDTLVFSVDYSDISVSMSGADVVLTYHDCHTVTIQQWFSGEAYRHMTMMSRDGVLFIISSTVIASVKLVARGINKMSQNHSVTVDTTTQHLSAVITILGSPYDDRLIGNGEKNVMDGGGGEDHLIGGEDEDIYMVKNREKSKVWIQNYSTDKTTDLVIIDANLHDFKLRVDEDHIILQSFYEVVILDWFRSEADRHLQVLTKDLITFTLSDSKSDCVLTDPFIKCIRSQSIDYSKSSLGVEVDLQKDQALHSVTEVRGSDLNDVIKGNQGRNTIFPGKGDDFVEGRGGEDWYVITPGQGLKTINNYSPDMTMDTMFLKEQYQHIMSVCEGNHVILLVNGSESVVLKQWFISNMYQHLDFQTTDGITFKLGSNTISCGDSLMLPITVDYRKQETRPLTAQLKQQKLSVVVQPITTVCFNYNGHYVTKEMCGYQGRQMIMNDVGSVMNLYGSAGFDVMIGNNNNNLLDPFTGGALMSGGEGRDTYIIKPGYGHDILIDNFAEDMYDDTMLVAMDFLSGGQMILTTVGKDLKVNITNGGEILHICLLNYHSSPKHQHLILQSSDGVFFRLRDQSGNESNTLSIPHVEAFKVNMKETQANCHLDLYAQGNLSAVHTVQGCPSVSNYIQGHNQQNILIGGWKNDVLEGGQGNDVLMGGVGNDLLMGGFGDDTLYGEVGEDTMMGGSGWDLFIPGPGADLVDGGPGRDTVLYQGDHETGEGVYVNLLSGECRQADAEGDVLKDVENVIGSIYSDVLVSGFEAGLLKGSDGHDILVSSGEGDYLVGGEGNDLYTLAFHQGSLTIDNCAKDNRTDILYLSSDFSPQFECHQLLDRAVLTFSGVNEWNTTMCVKVTVQGWVSDEHECGHLVVVLGDREMSVDRMLEECSPGGGVGRQGDVSRQDVVECSPGGGVGRQGDVIRQDVGECFFRHIEPVRAYHQHMSHMLLSYSHLAQLYQESEFQEEN
ncbi:hypothetical protein NHX12_028344 [Muraenolepis orangiensis]|uniref:Peptidase C80 domain-containing protein n=1 Tax=Muraenolepis orangiensis TaxID=630683 RepID=A0A9Q0EBM0_9TELE|nr:hypothetical protein NHX12_028344 [Muraenolepis orangiensis]